MGIRDLSLVVAGILSGASFISFVTNAVMYLSTHTAEATSFGRMAILFAILSIASGIVTWRLW